MTGARLSAELCSARTRCWHCKKWAYTSRREVRYIIRTVHAGDKQMMAYRCPADKDVWHVGHSNKHKTKGRL